MKNKKTIELNEYDAASRFDLNDDDTRILFDKVEIELSKNWDVIRVEKLNLDYEQFSDEQIAIDAAFKK